MLLKKDFLKVFHINHIIITTILITLKYFLKVKVCFTSII